MRRALALCLLALAALAAAPAAAPAAFGLSEAEVRFLEADGSPSIQAGSHPFAVDTILTFNTEPDPQFGFIPSGAAKDMRIAFPPGFLGDPDAMPYCPDDAFIAEECPVSAQVGVADIFTGTEEVEPGVFEAKSTPVGVYNLAPAPGVAAKIGFKALTVPITVELSVNPNPPYNLLATLQNLPQIIPFYGSTLRVWGTPADPAHDAERFGCGSSCSLDMTPRPFILLPRSCQPSTLATLFSVSSWESRELFVDKVAETPGLSGCETLGFSPRISSKPTTSAAESESGLDFSIEITDEGIKSPKGKADSDIKKAVVTLPPGVTANPGAANGLAACSAPQFAAEGIVPSPAGCPGASKLGTVEAETPLLEGTLVKGEVFLASQADNPFGTLIALYMILREPRRGIFVKLPGKVEPDPRTGQLITTFGEAPYELPQFPISRFDFHFREGAGSPLVTPPRCGTYETRAIFTPWANPGAPFAAPATFTIGSGPGGAGCPPGGLQPFAPGFSAGSINNSAGAFSPVAMRITRRDGEQDLTRFDAVLPEGLLGSLVGITRCPDAAIAAAKARPGRAELASPSCPASSAIGRVEVGAGVGSTLTYVPGTIYLAGPYGGNPLSLVVITPAVAGPFDVGTVVVRESFTLDPSTAQVKIDGAASDPIPHILAGIPLKVRDIRVYADRPHFTLNPTSCAEKAIEAAIFGSGADPLSPADDAPVTLKERYQASDCQALAFKPKLKLALKGKTSRGANTALRAEFRSRRGDANLKGALVTLPPSQFIDNSHIQNPCTRAQFAANACPKGSILGSARAFTPLLEEPLEGKVYFLSNGGARDLPDVVAALKGQFDFNLVIAILSNDSGRVRTKVLNAPDAPVSRFVLNLAGGRKGLLENSENLCARPQRANLKLTGQNGRVSQSRPKIKTGCAKGKGKAERR